MSAYPKRIHEVRIVSGWINTLVGGQKHGAKGFMFFIVNVDLSEEGIGKLLHHLVIGEPSDVVSWLILLCDLSITLLVIIFLIMAKKGAVKLITNDEDSEFY